jgi:enoyl-CoA hydratase/carnithine racemase
VKERIATITLNHPERLNAIDHVPGGLHDEILMGIGKADSDPDVGCIVVTGAGRAFSSGGKLSTQHDANAVDWFTFVDSCDRMNERARSGLKPTLGAINGLCYGAGFVLALHFDLLVASESARFGLIEARFGEPMGSELVYLIGPQWAKFLALTGELISAQKAREIGLILDCFADDLFYPKVYDLARRIASIPSAGSILCRRAMNAAIDQLGWKSHKMSSTGIYSVLGSVAKDLRAPDGRKFSEVRDKDWKEFKAMRDKPFTPGWFES